MYAVGKTAVSQGFAVGCGTKVLFLLGFGMQSERSQMLVPVTPKIISRLKSQQSRTGLSLPSLLKKQKELPPGLTLAEAMAWFDMFGAVKMAEKSHLDFILECWSKESDAKKRGEGRKRRKISKAYIKYLESEKLRTGVNPVQLLKQSDSVPYGLTVFIIREWLRGTVTTAYPEYLDFVLKTYKALPDKTPEVKKERVLPVAKDEKKKALALQSDLKPIKPALLSKLRHYHTTTPILPGFVFKGADDVPHGLKIHTVAGWLNGNVKSAVPEHVHWVLCRCQTILTNALDNHSE